MEFKRNYIWEYVEKKSLNTTALKNRKIVFPGIQKRFCSRPKPRRDYGGSILTRLHTGS
jgi:hypothetical protein